MHLRNLFPHTQQVSWPLAKWPVAVAILDFHLDPVWTIHIYIVVVLSGGSEGVVCLTSTNDSCTYIGLVEFQNISGSLIHVASLGKASITASNSRNKTNQGIFTERHEQIEDFPNHHSDIWDASRRHLKEPYLLLYFTLTLTRTDVFTNLLFISFHCSARYTIVTKHFRIPSQIPRKSLDYGLDFECNNLSMCTPGASVREYYHTAPPRAPRSRVLTILADRTRVEAVQSLRAVGHSQRRSTARFGPNSWRFKPFIPLHVKNYLFKKILDNTNRQRK